MRRRRWRERAHCCTIAIAFGTKFCGFLSVVWVTRVLAHSQCHAMQAQKICIFPASLPHCFFLLLRCSFFPFRCYLYGFGPKKKPSTLSFFFSRFNVICSCGRSNIANIRRMHIKCYWHYLPSLSLFQRSFSIQQRQRQQQQSYLFHVNKSTDEYIIYFWISVRALASASDRMIRVCVYMLGTPRQQIFKNSSNMLKI